MIARASTSLWPRRWRKRFRLSKRRSTSRSGGRARIIKLLIRRWSDGAKTGPGKAMNCRGARSQEPAVGSQNKAHVSGVKCPVGCDSGAAFPGWPRTSNRRRGARQEGHMAIDIRGLAPLLEVFDMPASIHFFRDVLGFELVTTSQPGEHFDWALLRLNGVEVMLNTAYEDGERPAAPDLARLRCGDELK